MVIVNIKGGLGNQMFQYAAGLSLAHHHQTQLKLHVAANATDIARVLELNCFHTEIDIANQEEVDRWNATGTVQRIIQRLLPGRMKSFYKERFFHFDPAFFNTGKNVYVKGFWQSEKYFTSIEKIIRTQFRFKESFNSSIEALAQKVSNENSVSMHIRRGDYLSKEVQEYHGILSMEYYESAVQLMQGKVQDARFYVFTDDADWVKAHFQPKVDITLVSGTFSTTSLEDFYLMSHCKHQIIANSSFSWWAAWLNSHAEKIVIAPNQWYKNGPKDTQDIIPENWIKI